MNVDPFAYPPPIELPPARPGGQIVLGRGLPERLARGLENGADAMALGRWSTASGVEARRAAAAQLPTVARRLRSHDLDITPALPTTEALIAAQTTSRRTSTHPRHGLAPFTLNVTTIRVTGTRLLIVLITGSGAQLDDDFTQPAIRANAALLEQLRPFLFIAPELTRVGRDGFGFAPFAQAFKQLHRHYGEPAWLAYEEDSGFDDDPEAMRIEPFGQGTERRLFDAGLKGRAFVEKFKSQASGGAVTKLLADPTMREGRLVWPSGGCPLPGLAMVRVKGAGRRGHTEAIVESPTTLPPAHEAMWGLPEVYDTHGRHVDQWATLVWLFEHMYTPGWTDENLLRAELNRRQFSWASLRRRTGKADATIGLDPQRCHKLLRLVCHTHLDAYFHRELQVRLPGMREPVTITGLPFALNEDCYDRIKARWGGDVRPRERRDTHLFTNAPVHLVDDDLDGLLVASTRRRDGVVYHLRHTDSTRRLGGYDSPVPPLPERDLLRAMLKALTEAAATFTAPLTHEPDGIRRLRVELEARAQVIAHLAEDQELRRPYVDPAAARRMEQSGEDPERIKITADAYLADAPRLRALQDQQREQQARLESREQRLGTAGLPVQDLLLLPRAVVGPAPAGLHHLILDALVGRIQVHRPVGGNGATPEKPARFEFQFRFHDPDVGTRTALAYSDYQSAWQRHGTSSLRRTLLLLADGVTLAEQGLPHPLHLPMLRAALDPHRPPRVLYINDPQILAMTMHVCHPLLPDADCTPGDRFTGPPVSDATLHDLAAAHDWPEPLLHRIRSLHLDDRRVASRWAHRASPKTAALYARGRRGRVRLEKNEKQWLQTPRCVTDWDFDGPLATLRTCATCGSRRLLLTRLDEIDGAWCAACGHDRAGIHWDRQYRAFTE